MFTEDIIVTAVGLIILIFDAIIIPPISTTDDILQRWLFLLLLLQLLLLSTTASTAIATTTQRFAAHTHAQGLTSDANVKSVYKCSKSASLMTFLHIPYSSGVNQQYYY